MPGRIAFVVNGDEQGAIADRARAFASRLSSECDVQIAYRHGHRGDDTRRFAQWLSNNQPATVYVFDMAVSGIAAASWYCSRSGARLIVDTGDAIAALAHALRGPLGIAATTLLERFAFWRADDVVVRGSFHKELLEAQGVAATFIPDGVDLNLFSPRDGKAVRRQLGVDGCLTVGIVGSCVWSDRLQIGYGWDLVELLGILRNQRLRGIVIGDGSGIERLRQRARELRVDTQMLFLGRRPLAELSRLLSACDICLSTQTNDVCGNVRTTGKLPLYLACGRYILASDVGEARRVLPADMRVPYDGTVDREYPKRLAERIATVMAEPSRLERGAAGVAVARAHFDYDVLAARLSHLLASGSLPGRQPAGLRQAS